ncbi:unnamed protein product [Penicillium salamii]|uniref:C2H2-type domain-containing protein n=1 Tax=Penicillium salamii TaxID=1612424 RepID=A0A9W4JBK1_9EURO|nr:unnamed protein product [Penicillium salamii]CAG8108171.1 unnamed protein product [Penicillium salamii]CAG8313146.1 unnamed protein product [Penicillium salamii]CAG8359913.1 unnamed protein product [Penicillium salamii]CAG8385931.1 unnamed protein product [Penicillium salamii]
MSTNEKVRCTYSACGHFFRSTKEMQSHKAYADHHYYCTKCDMDFGNHALLHLHKVMSEHHFACLECDMELRSQAGLRHHVKITHSQGKAVSCLGCDRQYKSAAAVMKHIEEHECPVLLLPDRLPRDAGMESTAGELLMESDMGSTTPPRPDEISDDESEGGVILDLEADTDPSAPGDITRFPKDWPTLSPVGAARAKSHSISTESTGGVPVTLTRSLLDEDVPILSRVGSIPRSTQEDNAASDGEDIFSDDDAEDHKPNAHGNMMIDPADFWDPEQGVYACNCHANFSSLGGFIRHNSAEDTPILDCPRCGKRFQTRVAHTAHVEAPFSKCAVRATTAVMKQELSAITQGFAEIKGHDQQARLDDIRESSQASNPDSDETARDNTLEAEPVSIPESSANSPKDTPGRNSAKADSLENPQDHMAGDLGWDTLDNNLVQQLKGLFFGTKQRDDEKRQRR